MKGLKRNGITFEFGLRDLGELFCLNPFTGVGSRVPKASVSTASF